MVAVRFDLFLAAVERERAEVADLFAIDLQDNLLRLHIVILAHAVQRLEPGFGIQIRRQLECVGKNLHGEHPIQGVHVRLEVLVVILVAVQVPAALELPDEIRLQLKGPFLVHAITLIAYLQFPVIPDCLDNCSQELMAGWHILEKDPVLHSGTLVQEGVQAKGVQHPRTDTGSVHILFVGDTVGVVPAVADNLDSEDIEYRFYMIRERACRKVTSEFIHGTPLPQLPNLGQCKRPAALECLQ